MIFSSCLFIWCFARLCCLPLHPFIPSSIQFNSIQFSHRPYSVQLAWTITLHLCACFFWFCFFVFTFYLGWVVFFLFLSQKQNRLLCYCGSWFWAIHVQFYCSDCLLWWWQDVSKTVWILFGVCFVVIVQPLALFLFHQLGISPHFGQLICFDQSVFYLKQWSHLCLYLIALSSASCARSTFSFFFPSFVSCRFGLCVFCNHFSCFAGSFFFFG